MLRRGYTQDEELERAYNGALVRVDAAYAATRARLAGDPEYQELRRLADEEAATTPDYWLARNRLVLMVEAETPLFPSTAGPTGKA